MMFRPLKEHYQVPTDNGDALRTFDYIEELEKYCDWLESIKDESYCNCLMPMTDSRDTFSRCHHCHKKVSK